MVLTLSQRAVFIGRNHIDIVLTLCQRAVYIGHNHIDIVLTLSQRARTVSAADTFLKEMVRGSPVCQLGLPPTKLLIFTNISSTAAAAAARCQQARQPWLAFVILGFFQGHDCCAGQSHLQAACWCRTKTSAQYRNVFHCPQALLNLGFQCGTGVSEVK